MTILGLVMILVLEGDVFVVIKHLQAAQIDQQLLLFVLGTRTRSLPFCPGRHVCFELDFKSGKRGDSFQHSR